MPPENATNEIDFSFDASNLYREETYTDAGAGSIRILQPVTADGTPDASRTTLFIGTLQLMTPQGPLPIQSRLMGNNLKEAIAVFAETMQSAVAQLMAEVEKMAKEEKRQSDSRIIVPGAQ